MLSAPFRLAAAISASAALLALLGCGKGKEKEPVVAVETQPVRRMAIEKVISAEAILYPLHEAALTPKVNAPVRKFYVNRGDKVHRGKLLALLENRDLSAAAVENQGAYEQAQANYESTTTAGLPEEMQKAQLDLQAAKQEYDAQKKVYDSRELLFKQGALPRKDLDQARVQMTQARAQYDIAQTHLNALQHGGKERKLRAASGELTSAKGKYLGAEAQLSYSQVRSPIDGVVTDRPLYPGEMASSSTPLITVMDLSKIIAKAHIPQQEAATLTVGDTATIIEGGISVPAKVTLVSPAVDPNSTTVEIWVQADNPKNELRPGSTARVSMVAQQVEDALVIPASALLTSPQGENSVMVVGGDGRAHNQPVHVGIRNDDHVQVTAGLNAGQSVITTGAYGLPDNTKVRSEPISGRDGHGTGAAGPAERD